MTDTKRTIEDLINDYVISTEHFAEHDISNVINSYIKANEKPNIPTQWKAEAMAFDFVQDYQNKETSWGTYYGPFAVWNNKDGTTMETPSIKLVTPEIIDYWKTRADEAKHPVLKLRYADLVWDFSKEVDGRTPHYSIVHIIVDSTIEIANQNLHKYETDIITKLNRALSVAIFINDSYRIQKMRDTIIAYEDAISIDKNSGSWGFSYDLLFKNKKVPITPEIKEKIIKHLEVRLERLSDISDKNNIDPWATESAALRLASYYRSINQKEDIKRVLLKFGATFEEASKGASAIQTAAWLQRVHAIYLDFGLREEAEQITIKLKDIGPKLNDEMHPLTHEMKVSQEELNDYIDSIIDENLESTFAKIAIHYIPQKDEVENQLKNLSQKAPISYLFSRQIQDYQGRAIASIGTLEDDLIGNIVHLTSQNMSISSAFLRCVIDKFIAKFELTPEKILDYLYQSPVFDENKKPIIFEGMSAYLNNNHLVAIHLLIPQIESAIRTLVEHAGGSVLKPSRSGGMHLKTLDELLRDPRIINIFGEDIALYFRTLLTDPRGWNLRNDVCHGISPALTFQINISDRVFHALLCLALVREGNKNNKGAEPSASVERRERGEKQG